MNRKWLVLFLALLLCGCRNQHTPAEPSGAAVPAIAVTEPTDPVGFYDPENPVEQATGGAVKAYPLDTHHAWGIRFLGEDILLFSGQNTTTLTLLSGNQRYNKAQINLPCAVSPDDPSLLVDDRGLSYVNRISRELVFLNSRLAETHRIPLPEGCDTPVLAADRKLLYYCTGDALRVLDLETGLDKLLREMAFSFQSLTALHCNDLVLQCLVITQDGSRRTLFFDAETGGLLYEYAGDLPLWTSGNFFAAYHMDENYPQWIAGAGEADPRVLVLEQEPSVMVPVPELQAMFTYGHNEEGTPALACYDLESGYQMARQTIPDMTELRSPLAQKQILWFLCSDPVTGQDVLYAWNTDASSVTDDTIYLQTRWSRDNPDLEGLARCSLLAREISDKHGVNILIWADATAFQPWDYTLVSEYQVPLLRRRLEELDRILSLYPEGFLEKAASGTGFGRLSIYLVRFINGNTDTPALDSAMGLQFWDAEAHAYLAVTVGEDMAQHLYHELFHIIDSRVLSTCNAYDNWNSLNPKGFSYDAKYTASHSEERDSYLDPENRYFIDLYSMTYPKEDRARIMEYAMLSGQESYFQSAPMQAKLRTLCVGIRKAFDLEEKPEVYRWEQYLHEPLDPT